jgi:Heparinase II/III N-terminus/Heparinase II/III-like protein
MQNRQKILRNLKKIQKLWVDKGANTVFKKVIHMAANKMDKQALKKTIIKRDLLISNDNIETLREDIERNFSIGLLRPLDKIRSDIRLLPAEVVELILEEAEKILKHEFTIYGSLGVRYDSNQFLWSLDPLTGFTWPQKLTPGFFMSQKPNGTDIKTIWEIARFQFLSSLSYAYVLSEDEQYAHFAVDKVNSWIDENPFQQGPHWIMPMESSIRLINWCLFLPLLDIFKIADINFIKKLTSSILEHLLYIRDNIEISPSHADNHYLANLMGLLTSSLLFPSLDWATECTNFAINEFENEIKSQYKKSGINFEGSLAYHRLSSEICLLSIALIKKNGSSVPLAIRERLKQISEFTKYCSNASDEFPVIGDNDSGLCINFFPGQASNRYGYLNVLFDTFLGESSEPSSFEEFLCSIHFNETKFPKISDRHILNNIQNSRLQVREFDGLIIARHSGDALFFNTLHSSEGHTHNDKLSVYPVIGKKLLFLDRGSFSYTGFPDIRHQDRMSASHNAIAVKDWEQNTIWQNDPFYNNGEAKCFSTIEHSKSILKITGWHVGYERFGKGIKVFRQIKWDTQNRTILISDWLEGEIRGSDLRYQWHFLINPAWTIEKIGGDFALFDNFQRVKFENIDGVNFEIVQSNYCPNYQIEKRCEALAGSTFYTTGDRTSFLLSY